MNSFRNLNNISDSLSVSNINRIIWLYLIFIYFYTRVCYNYSPIYYGKVRYLNFLNTNKTIMVCAEWSIIPMNNNKDWLSPSRDNVSAQRSYMFTCVLFFCELATIKTKSVVQNRHFVRHRIAKYFIFIKSILFPINKKQNKIRQTWNL
jgi:hypothetical protein